MNKWIDAKIEPPNPRLSEILIYSVNKVIHIVHRDYDTWLLWETDRGFPGESIEFTHWMRLPKSPKLPKKGK